MSDLDGIILGLKKLNQLIEGLKKTCSVKEAIEKDGHTDSKEKEEKLNEIIKLSYDASKIGHIANEAVRERTGLRNK